MEGFLLTAPAFPGETFKEYLEANDLWEHDLRHGLRSADTNEYLVELRELAHDPNSGVELLVEQGFQMAPVYLGYIDLIVLDRRSGELEITIHDHKFMSNKRSVMTEDEGRRDYQTVIYAKSLIQIFSVNSVTFSYDYYGTKYKWAENLKLSLTASEINDSWLRVLSDTSKVLDNYNIPQGITTTPNFISCGMYGGCEYKQICFGESK